jgi:hypothetical protein
VDWLSNNWKILFEGIGGAAVVSIIGYLCKRFFWPQRPSGHAAAITAQGARVSDSPVASGSGITQTVGGTHHHHYPPAVVSQPPAIESEPAPETEPQQRNAELASLSPLGAREVLLHSDSAGVWHEASTDLARARKAIVLPFKNVPKPPGQRTPCASNVSSSLVFKNAHGSEGMHINHGVWLGRFEYPARFDPGVTHELLVGLKDVPFVTFENANAYNPRRRRFRPGMVINPPQMKVIEKEGTVEIILVDGHHVTMFQGMFEYHLSVEKMVLLPMK